MAARQTLIILDVRWVFNEKLLRFLHIIRTAKLFPCLKTNSCQSSAWKAGTTVDCYMVILFIYIPRIFVIFINQLRRRVTGDKQDYSGSVVKTKIQAFYNELIYVTG